MGRFISWVFSLTFAGILFAVIIAAGIFYYYGAGLPDYKSLDNYEPPVVSRLYSNDGRLFAEYAHEKRIYVTYDTIPNHVKQAFLSAEDKNFYSHFGIDIPSIIAAAVTNVKNMGSSRRPIGASTITQQVAKNFLLANISHMVSLERKIKEAILSLRIERAFSKDYIFELYLNEVFLGHRSYGVAAAALNYFNKSLNELTISEAAFFAALPKAPSRYHPAKNPKLTYARRNWVIDRMHEDGHITKEQADAAKAEKIVLVKRSQKNKSVKGTYFAEEVRRELIQDHGENAVYKDGYVVQTTLDPRLQTIAEEVMKDGLETYDRDHGWRGPIANIDLDKAADKAESELAVETNRDASKSSDGSADQPIWLQKLLKILRPAGSGSWTLAIALDVGRDEVKIGLNDGSEGYVLRSDNRWARRWISDESKGPAVSNMSQVLKRGDVILVEAIQVDPPKAKEDQDADKAKEQQKTDGDGADNDKDVKDLKTHKGLTAYNLRQIPAVSGALVVMEPHTGRVLAMQGGYDFEMSQFNRATQAKRQTGSSFKPFSIIPALEYGLTPSTVLDDSPFAIDIGYGLGIWRPKNWDEKFKGPITMRRTFELSRNVAVIRMIHEKVGMNRVVDVARRFDVDPNMPKQLAGILGASETTPLKLTTAYAMIANGGRHIKPVFYDHIQNRRGQTVVTNHNFICEGCQAGDPRVIPVLTDNRGRVTDPITAYQMTSILRGAVERGLGRAMKTLPHQVTAKSGTTNDFKDAWMLGYSPTLVVGVYVGFDAPRTLGKKHYGSKVAGPIFKEYMRRALLDKPVVPFSIPKGVKMIRVNAFTGAKAYPGDKNAIYEAFKPDSEIPDYYNAPTWDNAYEVAGEDTGGGYPQSLYGPRSAYTSDGRRDVSTDPRNPYHTHEAPTAPVGPAHGYHDHNSYSGQKPNNSPTRGSVSGTGGLY